MSNDFVRVSESEHDLLNDRDGALYVAARARITAMPAGETYIGCAQYLGHGESTIMPYPWIDENSNEAHLPPVCMVRRSGWRTITEASYAGVRLLWEVHTPLVSRPVTIFDRWLGMVKEIEDDEAAEQFAALMVWCEHTASWFPYGFVWQHAEDLLVVPVLHGLVDHGLMSGDLGWRAPIRETLVQWQWIEEQRLKRTAA